MKKYSIFYMMIFLKLSHLFYHIFCGFWDLDSTRWSAGNSGNPAITGVHCRVMSIIWSLGMDIWMAGLDIWSNSNGWAAWASSKAVWTGRLSFWYGRDVCSSGICVGNVENITFFTNSIMKLFQSLGVTFFI